MGRMELAGIDQATLGWVGHQVGDQLADEMSPISLSLPVSLLHSGPGPCLH